MRKCNNEQYFCKGKAKVKKNNKYNNNNFYPRTFYK